MPAALARLVLAFAAIAASSDFFFAHAAGAEAPEWPQAWFEPVPTASQVGIKTFSQSPALDDKDLPPLVERLPDDPVVVTPLGKPGVYGGTARITTNEWLTFPNVESPLTISADMRTFMPNLAESWTVSPDGRIVTLKLRKGIKWSDGSPLTSDDFLFVFNDLWMNEEFTPVPARELVGAKAGKIDDLAFSYVFVDPYPLFVNRLAHYGNFLIDSKAYYKQFHPNYVDPEELSERISEMGYISWMAYVDASRRGSIEESAKAPTLDAHRMVHRTVSTIYYERNPYYFKIDPIGQQLPYIDGVISEEVESKEVITTMAATGQLDFSAFELRTQDIPLLKLGEQAGAIKVHVWRRLHASDIVIQFNFNTQDERLRELYWDVRFRRALSIALNREEMNQLIYFGRGTPGQVTAHPTSRFHVPEYATAWTQHDPAEARHLFEEIGLKDTNGDGLLEYADGSQLTITVEYIDWETPKAINMELVESYWRAVGIDLRQKLTDSNIQTARAGANQMQMTVWHADIVTDVLLPLNPYWWAPVASGWHNTMWNDWVRWYRTDGRLGTEPPPEMRQLQDWNDQMRFTMDGQERTRLGIQILDSNAENLWTLGAVGLAPHPVVVNSRLRGIPDNGIWGWDNRWTLSYHPSTWYFEGGRVH